MRYAGRLSPEEFWAWHEQMEAQVRDQVGMLPLFGVADWSGPLLHR